MKKQPLLPKSLRKHVRRQKAAIRAVADPEVRARKLVELRAKVGLK